MTVSPAGLQNEKLLWNMTLLIVESLHDNWNTNVGKEDEFHANIEICLPT